jgi:hypothetical protein
MNKTLLLAVSAAFVLAGCGKENPPSKSAPSSATTPAPAASTPAPSTTPPAAGAPSTGTSAAPATEEKKEEKK